MLLSNDLAGMRLEIGVKTSAPSSVSENLSARDGGLHGRHRLPMIIWISFAPTMVRGDEDLHAIRPSGREDLPHMLDNIVRLECRAAEFVELAPFRQEVVVGIDDKQPRQFRFVGQLSFRQLRHTGTPFGLIDPLERVLTIETLDETLNDARWSCGLRTGLLPCPLDGFTPYSTSSNLQLDRKGDCTYELKDNQMTTTVLDRFRLDGKAAIVTGASSGLGIAFAQALGIGA